MSKTGPFFVSILLFCLIFSGQSFLNQAFAQKKKVTKKAVQSKKDPKSVQKTKESVPEPAPKLSKQMKWVYADVFIGPSMNFAKGDFLEYQKQNYLTTNPDFFIAGQITNIRSFTFGAQARVYPFRKPASLLSALSFCMGGSYLRKGFSHEFGLQNRDTSINYLDETRIKEEWDAYFLSTYLTARYGKKLYVEAGISVDWFLSGVRNYELTRRTSGENAYQGGFSTKLQNNDNLSSKIMAKQSVGWVFGVGYQIIDYVGIRISNNFNSHFFKNGADFSNYQPSIQVTLSLP